MDRRPELQRTTRTLWEQLSTPDPAIRDEGRNADRSPLMHTVGRDSHGESDRRPCALMDAISHGESVGRGTINWKPRLGDRLRLRRDANALSTTISNRRAEEDGSEEEEEESKAPAAATMSLVALLEQTDSQWDDDEDGVGGDASKSGAVGGAGDLEDGEGREEEEMMRACCVCLVRHKGAAFIPCGHTFCRLCSRELLLARATCPLCNAFIHDILHIF